MAFQKLFPVAMLAGVSLAASQFSLEPTTIKYQGPGAANGITQTRLLTPSASVAAGNPADFELSVYAAGITDPAGQAAGLEVEIGLGPQQDFPTAWTTWFPASYVRDESGNDVYRASLTAPQGSYSVVGRARRNGGAYFYGDLDGSANNLQVEQYGSLVVTPAARPANDDFVNAELIFGASGSVMGTNVSATTEADEGSASASVWYRWTAPETRQITFSTCGNASFDTILTAYTGSSLDGLTFIADNDDFCNLQSRILFLATAGVEYRIRLSGFSSNSQGPFSIAWAEDIATPTPTPFPSPTFTFTPTPFETTYTPTPSPSVTVTVTPTATLDPNQPQPPGDLRGTSGATSFLLQWNPSPERDVLGYRVYRREQGASDFLPLIASDPPYRLTSYRDTAVQPGTVYTYYVVAVVLDPEAGPVETPGSNLVSLQLVPLRLLLTGANAPAGGTVRVSLGLENSDFRPSDLDGISLLLRYDPEVLQFVEEVPTIERSALTADYSMGSFLADGPGAVRIVGNPPSGGGALLGSGHLLHQTFRVRDEVTTGTVTFVSVDSIAFQRDDEDSSSTVPVPFVVEESARVVVSETFTAGDWNGTGTVTVDDAAECLAAVAGELFSPVESSQAGDLNRETSDRLLDAADATLILRLAQGLPITNPEPQTQKSQDFQNTSAFVDFKRAECSGEGQNQVLTVPLSVSGARAVANLEVTLVWDPEELEFLGADPKEAALAARGILSFSSTAGRMKVAYAQARSLGAEAAEVAALRFLVKQRRAPYLTLALASAAVGGEFSQRPGPNDFSNRGARLLTCNPADFLLFPSQEPGATRQADPNQDLVLDVADLLGLTRNGAFPPNP